MVLRVVAKGLSVGCGVSWVRPGDCLKHDAAIVGGKAERSQLVQGPAQSHSAAAADPAVGWPQSRQATARRGQQDGSPRLGADGEGHETGGDRRARPAGRAARPPARVPRVPGRASERRVGMRVAHAAGQLDHRQLGGQRSAGFLQPRNDRSVIFKLLVPERLSAPSRGDSSRSGKQVLGSPGDSVEKTSIVPVGNLRLRTPRQLQDAVGGQSD